MAGPDGKRSGATNLDILALARDPLAGCRTLRQWGHLPEDTGLFFDEKPIKTAGIVITHASLGHWALLPFMHPDIPLLSTPTTRAAIENRLARQGLAPPGRTWITRGNGRGATFATWKLRLFAADYPVPAATSVVILGIGRQQIPVAGHWGARPHWQAAIADLELFADHPPDLVLCQNEGQGTFLAERFTDARRAITRQIGSPGLDVPMRPRTAQELVEMKEMNYISRQCPGLVGMTFEDAVANLRQGGYTEDEVHLVYAEDGYFGEEIERALDAYRKARELPTVPPVPS